MKLKTSELTGTALNWAVAKCDNRKARFSIGGNIEIRGQTEEDDELPDHWNLCMSWNPSTYWEQGGPILTRERISRIIDHAGLWVAYWTDGYDDSDEGKQWMHCDRSELVAGLRCYVASKLGDEVELPEELK